MPINWNEKKKEEEKTKTKQTKQTQKRLITSLPFLFNVTKKALVFFDVLRSQLLILFKFQFLIALMNREWKP